MNALLVNIIKTSSRWGGTKYTALLVLDGDKRMTRLTNKHVYAQYRVKSGAINRRVTITHDDTHLLTIKEIYS